MSFNNLEDVRQALKNLDMFDPYIIIKVLEYFVDEIEKLQPPKQYIYQCLERGQDPLKYELIFSSDVKSDAVKWVKEYPNKRCFHERLE